MLLINPPLESSIREVQEETGLDNLKQLPISDNKLVPIDIDTHIATYNKRLNLPEHYHFDFRYMYVIDRIKDIKIDIEETSDYKWIDIVDLYNAPHYGKVALKIEKLLSKEKVKNKTLTK